MEKTAWLEHPLLTPRLRETNVWLVPINSIMGSYGLCSVSSLESCESVTCSDRPDGRGHPDSSSSCQLRMNMYFLLSICLPQFLLAY